MAEVTGKKDPLKGQNLENILGIVGQVLDVGGKFVFGPNANLDFGAPVKMAAGLLKEKREQRNLMDTLASLTGEIPEAAPILQQAQQVMDSGGLMNVLGQVNRQTTPEGLGGMLASTAPAEAQVAGASPMSNAGVLVNPPAPQPITSTISQPQASEKKLDLSSDETLMRVLQGAPHLAEPLLKARLRGSSDNSASQILAALRLQDYESPDERRQKDLESRAQLQEQSNQNIQERQDTARTENVRLQAEKLTSPEQKGFNDIDGLLAGLNTLEQDIQAGTSSDLLLGGVARRLGPTGERLVQAINPDKALSFKNQQEQAALFQKAISGVAVSEPEARRLAVTRPQPTDTPEVQQKLVTNLRKKTNELKLIHIANIQNRMKQSGGAYKGALSREAQLYSLIRDPLNKNYAEAIKDPNIQAIRQELGIDYGEFEKKK